MSDFFWFTDEQWSRIEPLLPTDTRGKARVDEYGLGSRRERLHNNLRFSRLSRQLPEHHSWTHYRYYLTSF